MNVRVETILNSKSRIVVRAILSWTLTGHWSHIGAASLSGGLTPIPMGLPPAKHSPAIGARTEKGVKREKERCVHETGVRQRGPSSFAYRWHFPHAGEEWRRAYQV